jgi:hypothetical protein
MLFIFQKESIMSATISRRSFTAAVAGLTVGSVAGANAADDKPQASSIPTEAPFARDYSPPAFKPPWKKLQINRQFVQDFIIYAHFDLGMAKKLLAKEPALLNATMDWGAGDWETGLGGASHMGRHDIAEFLLEKGARIDIFCAAMMGLLDAVRAFLTLQPKLIDAKGPHGFTLHFHAQIGGKESENVLSYLQSIKKLELKPVSLPKPPVAPVRKG